LLLACLALLLLPCLAATYVATGLYSVQPNEEAMVRRCGKALRRRGPGLHFGLPVGIDKVDKLKMLERKRVGVGMSLLERALGRRIEPQRAECLTGDRNLILVSAVVQYEIADADAYLFNVADVPALVSNVAASALGSAVSSMNVDDVLTVQRIAIQDEVRRATQERLDRYGAGVTVTAVSLEGVTPPQEVAQAFRDVTSAREDQQRAINEAEGYQRRVIPQARGEAKRILIDADAYREEVTQMAQGDAERFLKVASQLSDNRELTVKRLILETMEEVLPRLNKVILGDDAGNALDLGLIEEGQ
jgi:membrane protease subunit HflK